MEHKIKSKHFLQIALESFKFLRRPLKNIDMTVCMAFFNTR